MTTIQELETIVTAAAQEAGKLIRQGAFNYGRLDWKSTDDPVTDMDRRAEQHIRKEAKRIGADVVGEEYGDARNGSDVVLYVDPIDGTKSFSRGEFLSSVSIAAEHKGELVIGCVYDFMRGITYLATPTKAVLLYEGAEHPLPLKERPSFSKPTFSCTGKNDMTLLERQLGKAASVRRQAGSVALSMAQLAAGSYDGLIAKPYQKEGVTDTADIAAGHFIMRQAGLIITDRHGEPYDYKHPHNGIIAVHQSHKDMLTEALRKERKQTTEPREIPPDYGYISYIARTCE